jgi:hypothetical protein
VEILVTPHDNLDDILRAKGVILLGEESGAKREKKQ